MPRLRVLACWGFPRHFNTFECSGFWLLSASQHYDDASPRSLDGRYRVVSVSFYHSQNTKFGIHEFAHLGMVRYDQLFDLPLASTRAGNSKRLRSSEHFANGWDFRNLIVRVSRVLFYRGAGTSTRSQVNSPLSSACLTPGRGSTYRRGIIVQTTGTGSTHNTRKIVLEFQKAECDLRSLLECYFLCCKSKNFFYHRSYVVIICDASRGASFRIRTVVCSYFRWSRNSIAAGKPLSALARHFRRPS
jgi:hypothetical protein